MVTPRNSKPTPRPDRRIPRDRYGRPLPRGSADVLAHHQDPATTGESVVEAFERAVELFNGKRFFEAHEYFEFIWNSCPEDERTFWKGATQLAAGFCHCQRGNLRGALSLLGRATEQLGRYGSPYRGVDVALLLQGTRVTAAEIERDGATPHVGFPRLTLA